MLDLQAIVQAIGVEGRNRTERREAVSPFWIVVTSQEKLNEVVTALDSKHVELARLQDRFRIPVDLKQSDIAEVTARRVLAKESRVLRPWASSMTRMQAASNSAAPSNERRAIWRSPGKGLRAVPVSSLPD